MTDWSKHYATRVSRMQASEIREILKLLDMPDIISFAGGIPDPDLFPTAEIAAACQNILTDPQKSAVALQYAVSEGYYPLRQWLVGYMAKIGVTCSADNILITNGSQQALDFIGKLFISPNDTVLVAWPTYLGALQAFNAYEAQYDQLPGPGSNRTAQSYTTGGKTKPKFGYVMPEFQNPTGTSLTEAERIELLDAAEALDLPLAEDTAYEHLRYDGTRAPSLMELASKRAGGIDNAKIMYCGTFSKSIVPSLRIGWIVAPKEVIRKLVLIKQGSDLHVSPFNQMIMYEVASTIMDAHTTKIRKVYKGRRDAMLSSLAKHMPSNVEWTKPEGGMFIWLTLPPHIDGADLLQRSVTEIKVAFVPGSAFFADRSGRNTIRINFSLNDPPLIEEGVKRLSQLIMSIQDTGIRNP
jgi:DNA-binding transcriptional MocR family regulator